MRLATVLFIALFLLSPANSFAGDDCQHVPLSDTEFLYKLARQGSADAAYELAYGGSHDVEETAHWLRQAAEYGHVDAQHELCVYYSSESAKGASRRMTADDDAKWCQKAAEQGHHNAQGVLGALYYSGQGVPQSYQEAYFWFNLAGTYGVRVQETKKFLSQEQISALDARVKEWKPQRTPTTHRVEENSYPLINVEGLLCGGQTKNCKILDTCGDLLELNCDYKDVYNLFMPVRPAHHYTFFFVNKETKKIVSACGLESARSGCKQDISIPKDWTCGWPKNAPTEEDAQKAHMHDFD